jgi:hypothetical protein
VTDLPPTEGLLVDPHSERLQHGKDDTFRDWWVEKE